ncbi:hypothetical protein CMI37_32100 [Candidatus Pacearchaeota archaeon]|nr:hypothetical protein [Candidatus Pacearchaeota archaeon]
MVRVRDATAQTNYSFPGESKAIFPRAVDFDLQGFVGKLKNPVGGGSVTVIIDSPFGLCGSRTTGDYLPGPTNWGTLQATGVGISADRPLYILIDSEVMKSEEVDLIEGVTELYLSEFTGNETPAEFITADNVVQKPGRMNVTVTSGNRGMLDTTEAGHAVESSQETELPIGHVMDMTIAVNFAETTLQRFSNGCHMIELTTSLAQWAIQVGDVVTLDNDQFLAYGFDGLTSATKWEVVGKELSLNDSDAYIRWRLAFATKKSPPSIVVDWDWLPKYLHPIDFYSNNSFWWGGVGPHVTNGLDIETDSGLNVTLNAGLAAGTGIPHEATIPLSASKDHYVSFNARTNGVYVESVTTGGDDPGLLSTAVPLAKVVAGGSSVSSIDDRRTFGVISPTAFSAEEHEAGANLVWNPNFESWTRGSGYEPDHWELGGVSPTWATDWVKSESPHRGKYAVKSVTASTSKLLYSSHFPVEPGRSYQVGISVKPSSGSITVTARVEGLDSAKAYSAAYNIVSASSLSTSDWTTKTITYTAASGEHYARVRLGRSANAGTVLFDTLRFVRAMPSFFATNETQTIAKETTGAIAFTQEVYDHGSNYDAAAATFTAPFDGVYQFSAQVIEVTNDDADSYISFFKNGSLFLRSSWGNGHQINSGPIALASGDTIIPKFYNDYNGTATITGAATKCWFSGAQIQ